MVSNTKQRRPTVGVLLGQGLFSGYIQALYGIRDDFDLTLFAWRTNELPLPDADFALSRVVSLDYLLPSSRALTRFIQRKLGNIVGAGYVPGLEAKLSKFDLLYTSETYTSWTAQALKAKLRYGPKVIIQSVENLPFRREDTSSAINARKLANANADRFVAQTNQARDVLISEGANKTSISIVPMAVDTDLFRAKPKNAQLLAELGFGLNDCVILYAGRLLWVKGITDIVDAARILMNSTESRGHIKFLIAGNGPDKDLMLKLIDLHGLGQYFKVIDAREHRSMPEIYNLADIFVYPSSISRDWEEQFGLALVESMSCAKPVITTETGAIPEVTGRQVSLVPPHNPGELARAMSDLAFSPQKRAELGQQAFRWVQSNYSISVVSSRLKAEFLDVLGK